MYQDFPSTHPFAQCAASTSYTAPTPLPKPSITGPVPPRRSRPSITHTRSDSSISTTSTASSTTLLTPTSSRSTTPTIAAELEDESAFFARLSIASKQFGTSRRRSSQQTTSESFETFALEMQGKGQFGSVGRRAGMSLEERHERLAEKLEVEVEEAEIKSAMRVYLGQA